MLPQFMQLVEEARKEIKEISIADLKRMLAEPETFLLIDVREPEEVLRGKIGDAIPIPRGVLELQIDRVAENFESPLVLYCGGGNRSALAAQMLKKMGFTKVASLAGGWKAWCEQA